MAIGHRGANGNSATSTTASVTLPTGTAQGDLLVMVVAVYSGSTTWSDPSGWTNIAGSDVYVWNNASGLNKAKIWYKIAGSSEPNPSITLSADRRWAASISGYTGVHQTTPVNTTENTGWSRSSSDASHTASATTPALTASSGQWIVGLATGGDSASTTWTNDRTERADYQFFDTLSISTSIGDSNASVTGSVQITFTPNQAQQGCAALAMLLTEAASGTSANSDTSTEVVTASAGKAAVGARAVQYVR